MARNPASPKHNRRRMGVEWEELPQGIIESISKRLTISGSAVYVAAGVPLSPKPLSIYHHNFHGSLISHNSFYDLSTRKIHCLDLPLSPSYGTRICSSSHGWLVVFYEVSALHLYNPITHASLILPSLCTFPELVRKLLDDYNNLFLTKFVLLSNPSLSNDFAALAILDRSELAFYREGYDSWDLPGENEKHQWIDAVYKNGSFYVVDMSGTIAVCDVEDHQVSIIENVNSVHISNDIYYLVFSGDDMLLVTRYFQDEDQTVGFQILKMNWYVLKWEEVQTLVENALFIGRNASLSVSAADFVGCRPNCIYFTSDVSGKYDLGIFSLSDWSIEPLPCYPQNLYYHFGCPIWVTPNP